ncbi:GAF and ANTAR domain-containing protein [Mycolicibacterium psychrotolerans]|uniref:ANTAR domain-containing protein n=1 Tax=Mycolicibacterium psychrotolerans TaxID=216929 RepID=A0A7I7MHA0_9MYCO|nr:GAF and ANTAR domain-containing protein [Mycolicibacterium psychrotolerans]BBX71578.1 hypothetical protein MPSYJ_50390 [Mycolicibacterium psychrotolerans]
MSERLADNPADPATVFTGLAQVVYHGTDLAEVYTALCISATLMVPGCHHASVMVRGAKNFRTVAASDQWAREVDELERATGEGPCLDAIVEEAPQFEQDLRNPQRWHALAREVVAQTPVRAMMGFPFVIDGEKTGALNIFSDTPDGFSAEAVERAVVLASFATIAATAAVRGEDAAALRAGLLSNREIGKAIGMLMALRNVSDDEAFNLLRHVSQHMNIKMAEVARQVVASRGNLA